MMDQLAAEFSTTLRYFFRRPVVWFWLLAVVVWPALDIFGLGAQGTDPLVLSLNLAIIPVSPVLLGFVGAQLTDMGQARRAPEILRTWPVRPGVRVLASMLVLVLLALLSTLITNAVIGMSVLSTPLTESTWAHCLVAVGATDWLWLSGGYLVGQWVPGFWKIIVVILAPAVWLIATVAGSDPFLNHGLPAGQLIVSLQVAPLSWLTAHVSAIWGYGPYEPLFWTLAAMTVLLGVLWVVIAGLKGFGIDRYLAGALVLVLAGTAGLGLTTTYDLLQVNSVNAYQPLADGYHAGRPSRVRLVNARVTLSRLASNALQATITYTVRPQHALGTIPFFLNPALHVTEARINGRAVSFKNSRSGWDHLSATLARGSTDTIAIQYQGNPALSAAVSGAASQVAFVSPTGLLLPGGDWYPLVGLTGKTVIPWSLNVLHAPPYALMSNVGSIRSTGRSYEAQANNLALIGGHLAGVRFHGVTIDTGTDDLPALRKTLDTRGRVTFTAPGIIANLDTLLAGLTPTPKGRIIWPISNDTPPYNRTVDPVIPEMWPQGSVNAPVQGGVIGALTHSSASSFSFDVFNHFSRTMVNLWLTNGASSVLPTGTLLNEVVSSVMMRVQGGTNGQTIAAIAHLSLRQSATLLMKVRALHTAGRLNHTTLARAITAASGTHG